MSDPDQPSGPPPEPAPAPADNVITNVPPPDPAEPVLTKSMFDPPAATPAPVVLEATPLPPPEPEFDLREEFRAEAAGVDPRVTVEGQAPTVLTAEVVSQVEAISPEAAAAMVIGPSPDKSTIKTDTAPLHRKTVPVQTVQEAAEKAKTGAFPGAVADRVSQEEAKKLVEAEITRIGERYGHIEELCKKLNSTINPLQARDFQSFVRSHLAHVVGFYVVTGQPVNELRTEATAEQLAAEEAKLVEGLDPALARNPAAREALRMGWKPGDESGDIG